MVQASALLAAFRRHFPDLKPTCTTIASALKGP